MALGVLEHGLGQVAQIAQVDVQHVAQQTRIDFLAVLDAVDAQVAKSHHTMAFKLVASSRSTTPWAAKKSNASRLLAGRPHRRSLTTCIAKSMAASHARCTFRTTES